MLKSQKNGLRSRLAAIAMAFSLLLGAGAMVTDASFVEVATPVAAMAETVDDTGATGGALSGNFFQTFVKVDGDGNATFQVSDDDADAGAFIKTYSVWLDIFLSLITLTSIGIFIFRVFQIIKAGSNDQDRKKAMSAVMWAALGMAIIGSASVFISFAFGALSDFGG